MQGRGNGGTGTRVKLTSKLVQSRIEGHERGRKVRVWDTEVKGFYLQITPAGAASYCIRFTRIDGGKSDFAIGSAAVVPVEGARKKALEKLAAAQLDGVDPVAERKREKQKAKQFREDTFASLVERFDAAHQHNGYKDKRLRFYSFRKHILPVLGQRSFHEITIADVKNCVRGIQARVAADPKLRAQGNAGYSIANDCQRLIHRVYNWANEAELTDRNPARFKKLFDDTPEKRVEGMREDNFPILWDVFLQKARASLRSDAALAVLIFFATLQRPVDIARARRDHIDLESATWVVPKELTKRKKKPYYVPLSPIAKALLEAALARHTGEFLFPSKSWQGHLNEDAVSCLFTSEMKKLVASGKLADPDVELYDARRFGRTKIEKGLGFGKQVAELVINHYDGDMSVRYDEHDYRPDVRQAQTAWGAEIERMVGGVAAIAGVRRREG